MTSETSPTVTTGKHLRSKKSTIGSFRFLTRLNSTMTWTIDSTHVDCTLKGFDSDKALHAFAPWPSNGDDLKVFLGLMPRDQSVAGSPSDTFVRAVPKGYTGFLHGDLLVVQDSDLSTIYDFSSHAEVPSVVTAETNDSSSCEADVLQERDENLYANLLRACGFSESRGEDGIERLVPIQKSPGHQSKKEQIDSCLRLYTRKPMFVSNRFTRAFLAMNDSKNKTPIDQVSSSSIVLQMNKDASCSSPLSASSCSTLFAEVVSSRGPSSTRLRPQSAKVSHHCSSLWNEGKLKRPISASNASRKKKEEATPSTSSPVSSAPWLVARAAMLRHQLLKRSR